MPRKLDEAAAIAALQSLATPGDVAAFLGTSLARMNRHLYVHRMPYRRFEIPKRDGRSREIESPPDPVRIWQRKLAVHLRDAYRPKKGTFGFILDGGVVKNAGKHVSASIVLNIDLQDFFHAITFKRVAGMLRSKPLSIPHPAATVLAQLCCWRERLPQGAPTSPAVSNWVCRELDRRLGRFAHGHRCLYTRYADDLTISTRRASLPDAVVNSRVGHTVELGAELRSIIVACGFTINESKVWVRSRRERQQVTGLVVNERVNVKREYRRKIRAALHEWESKGYEAAEKRFHGLDKKTRKKAKPPKLVDHRQGKLEFLRQARGHGDPIFARYSIRFRRLCRAAGMVVPPFPLVGKAAKTRTLLKEALWIVAVVDGDGHVWWNGTGVAVGDAIVTNHHVIDTTRTPDGESEELPEDLALVGIRATDPDRVRHILTVVRESAHHDLAICTVRIPLEAVLVPDDQLPVIGDSFLLAGFPNWEDRPADEARFEHGFVTQTNHVSMVNRFQVGATVQKGNSGGPVVSSDGLLLGIATYGADGVVLPSSAVAIRHLDDCSAASSAV